MVAARPLGMALQAADSGFALLVVGHTGGDDGGGKNGGGGGDSSWHAVSRHTAKNGALPEAVALSVDKSRSYFTTT